MFAGILADRDAQEFTHTTAAAQGGDPMSNWLFDTWQSVLNRRRPTEVMQPFPFDGDALSLDPGAEPETNFQRQDDIYVAQGTINTAGDNIVLPKQNSYDVHVVSIAVQPAAAVTVQIKTSGNQFLSGAFTLSALQPQTIPGKIVGRSFDLIINLSGNVSTTYEVRWKPAYGRL